MFVEHRDLREQFAERANCDWFYFVALFSRFEYALKRGGFCKVRYAEADWHGFSDELAPGLSQHLKELPEMRILYDDPPRKLRLNNGDLMWMNYQQESNPNRDLFGRVKTVRNNLFHGDKRSDRGRDNELVAAGTFVLERVWDVTKNMPQFDEFRAAFSGYITVPRQEDP